MTRTSWGLVSLLLLVGCGQGNHESGPAGMVVPQVNVQNVATDSAPLFVKVADLDGDGRPEIVASDRRGNRVQLLSSQGLNGPYRVTGEIPLSNSPGQVAVGNFVGDARPDLAVALRDGTEIAIFDAADPKTATRVSVGTSPQGLQAADLDQDGFLDLAVSNVASNTLTVLFGQTGGGLGSPLTLYTGFNPVQVISGDFDGDDRLDLACSNFGSGSVSIFHNAGQRNFALTQTLPVGNGAFGLLAFDLDRDGKKDLVVANELDGTLTRYLLGPAGLGKAATFPVGLKPDCLTAADVDGDGFEDLLVTLEDESGAALLASDGQGGLTRLDLVLTPGGPVGIDSGDLEGNGLTQAVTANFFGSGISLLRGQSPQKFDPLSIKK